MSIPHTVHIGYDKTGSTALQHALFEGDDALAARGLLYPRLPRAPRQHVEFARSLGFGWPGPAGGDGPGAVEAVAAVRDASTLVLSSEHFCYDAGPEPIGRLRAFLGPCSRVVVVLRNQVDWLLSNYAEGVKRGLRRTLAEFAAGQAPRLDYAAFLAPWTAAFGRQGVVVLVHGEGDVVGQFEALLGAGPPLPRLRRLNPAAPPLLLEAFRRLDLPAPVPGRPLSERARVLPDILSALREGDAVPGPRGAVWPLPPALLERLDALEASNAALAREHLNRERLFARPLAEVAARRGPPMEAGALDAACEMLGLMIRTLARDRAALHYVTASLRAVQPPPIVDVPTPSDPTPSAPAPGPLAPRPLAPAGAMAEH